MSGTEAPSGGKDSTSAANAIFSVSYMKNAFGDKRFNNFWHWLTQN